MKLCESEVEEGTLHVALSGWMRARGISEIQPRDGMLDAAQQM